MSGLRRYLRNIVETVTTVMKGMWITARVGMDPSSEVTIQYPEERRPIADRFRGFLHNDIDTCISCSMCAKACPVDCITVESMRGADKKLVLLRFDVDAGRCMYCGLCVEVCPPKSLVHTQEFERSVETRDGLLLRYVTVKTKGEE